MGGSERGPVGGRHTTGREGLVAVAVVLGLVVIAAVWVLSLDPFEGDRPPAPAPGESGAPGTAPTPAEPPAVVTLTARSAPGRCRPPSAATLADQEVAVDAVVESVTDDGAAGTTVELRPTRVFAGARADRVEVEAPDADLVALLGATEFAQGDRYLVSGTDGSVTVCGLSGPWTPRLSRLYEQAFG